MSQTSSPNIAIKSHQQPSNPMTAEDRRTYWKRIISNIPNQKCGKTSRAVTTKWRQQAKNHNKRIQNFYMWQSLSFVYSFTFLFAIKFFHKDTINSFFFKYYKQTPNIGSIYMKKEKRTRAKSKKVLLWLCNQQSFLILFYIAIIYLSTIFQ